VLVADIPTHRLRRTATDLERNILPMLDVDLKLSATLSWLDTDVLPLLSWSYQRTR